MKSKRSKPAGMSASWAKDRCEQGQLGMQRAEGKASLGGHPAKHRAGSYQRQARPTRLLIKGQSPTALQGCSRILSGQKGQSCGPLATQQRAGGLGATHSGSGGLRATHSGKPLAASHSKGLPAFLQGLCKRLNVL